MLHASRKRYTYYFCTSKASKLAQLSERLASVKAAADAAGKEEEVHLEASAAIRASRIRQGGCGCCLQGGRGTLTTFVPVKQVNYCWCQGGCGCCIRGGRGTEGYKTYCFCTSKASKLLLAELLAGTHTHKHTNTYTGGTHEAAVEGGRGWATAG
jgi:hypothetical protein